LFNFEKKVLHLCFMNYLNSQELTRITAQGGSEKLVHVRPAEDSLVFKLNIIPGVFFLSGGVTPPGHIDPDNLPDNESPNYQGRILFDKKGNWIYDGDKFTTAEQEQLAGFIRQVKRNDDRIWNN
jgi:hypothetical protein